MWSMWGWVRWRYFGRGVCCVVCESVNVQAVCGGVENAVVLYWRWDLCVCVGVAFYGGLDVCAPGCSDLVVVCVGCIGCVRV